MGNHPSTEVVELRRANLRIAGMEKQRKILETEGKEMKTRMMNYQEQMEHMVKQIQEQNRILEETLMSERIRLRDENEKLKLLMKEMEESLSDQEKVRWAKLQAEREATRKKWGIDNVNKFNYAITGHTGVGKSSLLNALLGFDPKSEGAAKSDHVECTMNPTSYTHPHFTNFVFWDLPGAGTRAHPVETYYEDNALHAFDAILIVTGDRIVSIDVEIAKQSHEAKLPVAFVRSKADSSIRDIALDDEISMADAAKEFEVKVKDYFKAEMDKADLKGIRLFVVSSRGFYPKKKPYTNGNDKSLQGMDEPLLLQFISEKAGNRFPDSTDQLRAMTYEFSKRCLLAGGSDED